MIMRANLAGGFYPADKKKLAQMITSFFEQVPDTSLSQDILGIVSPHAGYVYSGLTAAYGFKAISNKNFDLAVIIAPCHRSGGFNFAVGNWEAFETPLGNLKVDQNMVNLLLQYDGFYDIPNAFLGENALETQLPFLYFIKPETKILPILIGNQHLETSKLLADSLVSVLKNRIDKTVIIASSDLSHYHDSNTAEVMDNYLIESIKNNNQQELFDRIANHQTEACGFGSILSLMYLAEKYEFDKSDILHYSNSGDASGDYHQVVGYLSAAFYK